jgi:hypothetical protein
MPGFRTNQSFLHCGRSHYPDGDMIAIVVVVVSHGEHLSACDPKCAFAPRFLLDYRGKIHTDLSEPLNELVRVVIHPWMHHYFVSQPGNEGVVCNPSHHTKGINR